MKLICTLLLTLVFVLTASTQIKICGGHDRWDVKTLTDTAVYSINMTPIPTCIDSLISLEAPKEMGDHTPRLPQETRLYTVICNITYYKTEDDKDYHIVIAEPSDHSKTMIVEIPNPICESVAKSSFKSDFIKVRKDFIKLKRNITNGKYRITGVLFFDAIHGQIGIAPNGVELHPVLKIEKVD